MLCIEIIKRNTSKSIYKNALQFKTLKKIPLAKKVLLLTTSGCISCYGGYLLPQAIHLEKSEKHKPSISIDSIKNQFAQEIATLEEERDNFKKSNSRNGKIRSHAISAYAEKSKLITDTKRALLEEVQRANAQNENNRLAFEAKQKEENLQRKNEKQRNSILFALIALFFEILFEVSLFYCVYWNYKTYLFFCTISDDSNEQKLSYNDNNEQPYIEIEGYKDPIFTEGRINQFINAYKSKLRKWNEKKSKGFEVSASSKETIENNLQKWQGYRNKILEKKI